MFKFILIFALFARIYGEVQPSCAWEGEYFRNIPTIRYEGPDSENLLAFHYYNASEEIMGKPMKEWYVLEEDGLDTSVDLKKFHVVVCRLRFSVAFWHSLLGDGSDPFGAPTRKWPWEDDRLSPIEMAKRRLEAAFEFMQKLGIEYWCFHDRDIAPEGNNLHETNTYLDKMVELASKLQQSTGIRLLWGTAQLFKHPRYMHGAATSTDPKVFAYAASQVKKCLEVIQHLGGAGYNLWGGREGYHTLRNTDMKMEVDHYAKFVKMLIAYKKEIGFDGALWIEPKPQEPAKHQYDFDAASTYAFLLKYGLEEHFKLVIECNHATLAGHSCEHEMLYSSINGILGSIDINTGDPQTGWDTDQFLTDVREATLIMAVVLKQGGIAPGGLNFDAKLRRESIDVEDLFYAHISSMDALARGLRNAACMIQEGKYDNEIKERYGAYAGSTLGQSILNEEVGFKELELYTLQEKEDPITTLRSGQAEKFEMVFNAYVR